MIISLDGNPKARARRKQQHQATCMLYLLMLVLATVGGPESANTLLYVKQAMPRHKEDHY